MASKFPCEGGSTARSSNSGSRPTAIGWSPARPTRRFVSSTTVTPGPIMRGHRDRAHALALSPDGKALASVGWDGEVPLWDPATGAPTRTFVASPR